MPITVPEDALPETYVATLKARREWGGEALNRAATIEIQVGTPAPTTFVVKTGRCDACHTGSTGLPNLLHGLNNRRACLSCHSSLAFEPDAATDIRIHEIHDRSDRFASLANINDCAKWRLTPPNDQARGLLGNRARR